MESIYIDESGSMTTQYQRNWPYFVIALVRGQDPQRLRTLHTRFVRTRKKKLEAADTENKMFLGERFRELKGSALTSDLKREFVSYFCRPDTMEIYYIVLDNAEIKEQTYHNKSRAFNYMLKLALEYFIRGGFLPDASYTLQLDERNERTETKRFLKDYLNTEFHTSGLLSADLEVQYFDSAQNKIIQLSDVLANLCYSQLLSGVYGPEINQMWDSGCLKQVFWFPEKETRGKHHLLLPQPLTPPAEEPPDGEKE